MNLNNPFPSTENFDGSGNDEPTSALAYGLLVAVPLIALLSNIGFFYLSGYGVLGRSDQTTFMLLALLWLAFAAGWSALIGLKIKRARTVFIGMNIFISIVAIYFNIRAVVEIMYVA